MYRTEKWYQEVQGKQLETPVCVPSYHRPDAKIFTSKLAKALTKDLLFVIIRNEKDEIERYKWLEEQNIATLVPLDGMTDLGNTRGAIVEEFYKRGYTNIFMFDDTVSNVYINAPHTTKTGNVYMGNAKFSDPYSSLLIWEYLHNNYKADDEDEEDRGAVLSGACYKGYDWEPSLIDAPIKVYDKIGCYNFICLNVKKIMELGLNYKAICEVGVEDIYLPYMLAKNNLPIRVFTDLSGEMENNRNTHKHGGSNEVYNEPRVDRLNRIRAIFVEKTLHRAWGQDIKDLGMVYRKSKNEGYVLGFNTKYWKQKYKENKEKKAMCNDLYHIPGDKGGSWRFDKMIEYISNFPDEIGPIVNSYLKDKSDDYKTWWVFLYSTCYCMGSAMLMCEKLDYQTINDKDIDEFWVKNKEKLIFQSDRRYIKNINQFPIIVKEFINRSNRKPYEYISRHLCSDPKDTYDSLYKEVSTWKYYGRFSVILFIYNLSKVFPSIELQPTNYDWKNGATTTSAIFNVIYEDKLASDWDAGKGFNLDSDDINTLDAYLNLIIDGLKKANPNKVWNIINVSSDLCSYRKLFKGVRYQGYYVDRQQEEISTLEKNNPDYKWLWDFIWNARKENINNVLLGELNGWNGIRKEREKLFLEHGYIGIDICPEF